MKRKLHAAAGTTALTLIIGFWGATAVSELSGDLEAVRAVKQGILWGMAVLILCLVATGLSGVRLSGALLAGKGRTALITAKQRRMKIIALNGLLVLLPSAVFLAQWAGEGRFDTAFIAVQAVELIAGALNITLMIANLRDGLALRRRLLLSA